MRRRSNRRGVLLLVMLSMLSLLAVIVITYVVVAGIKKRAAAAFERAEFYGTPPEELLNSVALDLLRDTRNPASVLQGHSLLADLYGEDGVVGQAAAPTGLVGAGGTRPPLFDRQMFWFRVSLPSLVYADRPDYVQLGVPTAPPGPPGRLFDGFFSGCVLTFLEGPLANQSMRIVDYRVLDSSQNGTARITVMTPSSGLDNSAITGSIGSRFLINGRPFNGVGAGLVRALPNAPESAFEGTTSRTVPVRSLAGDPLLALPMAFAVNHANSQVRSAVDPSLGAGFSFSAHSVFDEDYDAPDYLNLALAMMVPNPVNSGAAPQTSFSPSGSVVLKPSFYDPALQSFYETQLGLGQGTMGNSLDHARLWSMISLRPNPALHPGFARQNPRLNIFNPPDSDPYYQTPVVDGEFIPPPWDVDNTGDGLTDSVWIDPGLPVQTMADGRRYKVMAAILCVDLDGRLNVNAHGAKDQIGVITRNQMQMEGPFAQSDPGSLNSPTLDLGNPLRAGAFPGLGYGPADVNLALLGDPAAGRPPYLYGVEFAALVGASTSSELTGAGTGAVIGRYGLDAQPGFPGFDTGLAASQPELLRPLSAPNPVNNWNAYARPHDFAGIGVLALDYRGQPVYRGLGGWGYDNTPPAVAPPFVNDILDNPYEFEPAASQEIAGWWQSTTQPGTIQANPRSSFSPRDNPFTPGELERLLRWHDSDAESLPDRLLEIGKVGSPRYGFGGPFDVRGPELQDSSTGAAVNASGLPGVQYRRQFQEAGRLRAMTTTESWDLPVPNLAVPADLRTTISQVLRYEPLHVTDLLLARLAQANEWSNAQVFDGSPESAARRQSINRAIQFYLSSEMRAGLRFNLNRPFGDGVDNDGDHIVDEGGVPRPDRSGFVGGEHGGDGTPTDAAYVDGPGTNKFPDLREFGGALHVSNGDNISADMPYPPPSNAAGLGQVNLNDAMVRQIYARHLYLLAQMLVEPLDPISATEAQYAERARILAQWAVNVVDYRDRDSAMTFFEYDIHPFRDDSSGDPNVPDGDHFWDVDGFPSTDDDEFTTERFRGIVWGVEKPELLITETMAWHDHRVAWLDEPPPGQFAEYARPVGSLLVELHNPGDRLAAGGELGVDAAGNAYGEGVVLNKMTPPVDPTGAPQPQSPVWRLAIVERATDPEQNPGPNDVIAPYEPYRPLDIRAAAYFTPGDLHNETAAFQTMTLPDGSSAELSERDGLPRETIRFAAATNQSNLVVLPGRYAAIGSSSKSNRPTGGDTIFAGRNTDPFTGGDKDDAPTYALNLKFSGNQDLLQAGRDFKMFGRTGEGGERRRVGRQRQQVLGVLMAPSFSDNNGQTWVFQGPADEMEGESGGWNKLRFSISEPERGYSISSLDNLQEDFYDPLSSQGQLEDGTPPDLDPSNSRRVIDTLDLSGGFKPQHAKVYLQRLADPQRPFDPLDNPYISVDSAAIDLNGYTGDDATHALNNEDDISFASRERGKTLGQAFNVQNPWNRDVEENSTPPRENPVPGMGFAIEGIDQYMSFGYLNTTFGRPIEDADSSDPAYVGDPLPSMDVNVPGGPFPWFAWGDRPLVSAAELLLVPSLDPRELLLRHSTRHPAVNPYEHEETLGETAEFSHLGGLLATHEHVNEAGGGEDVEVDPTDLHRLLEFVHVPSRFSGLETELYERGYLNQQQQGSYVNELSDYHIWPGFHFVSDYREPGKLNANTIMSEDVWKAVTGGLQSPQWGDLVESRKGFDNSFPGAVSSQFPYVHGQIRPINGTDKVFPSVMSNPFRSFAGGGRQPLVQDGGSAWTLDLRQRDVDATFYRPEGVRTGGGSDTVDDSEHPLLSPVDGANDEPYNDDQRNPYFRYHGHQKLANLLTTRSNVYAVWITIGFFEVRPIMTEEGFVAPFTGLPPATVAELVPDGWQIGPEIGSETGDYRRHRAFYLIDRTRPVGYLRGEDLNADEAIVLQRFIE